MDSINTYHYIKAGSEIMKLGYPCINRQIGCAADKKFRLKSYSETKLIETIENNLTCLQKVLEFNVKHGFYFFRISSDTIPFASHPINQFDWVSYFAKTLQSLGKFIKQHDMRISMHPGQFVVLNSPNKNTIKHAVADLVYHCELLDAMELNNTAKVQIHVGGIYADKTEAMYNFDKSYLALPELVKNRLVIENDDRSYTLADCLKIYNEIGVPVIFDNLHHACLNDGESLEEAFGMASKTWRKADGVMMVDYSSQESGKITGRHADSLDEKHFENYLKATQDYNFDIMLEIKDKEASALKAIKIMHALRG